MRTFSLFTFPWGREKWELLKLTFAWRYFGASWHFQSAVRQSSYPRTYKRQVWCGLLLSLKLSQKCLVRLTDNMKMVLSAIPGVRDAIKVASSDWSHYLSQWGHYFFFHLRQYLSLFLRRQSFIFLWDQYFIFQPSQYLFSIEVIIYFSSQVNIPQEVASVIHGNNSCKCSIQDKSNCQFPDTFPLSRWWDIMGVICSWNNDFAGKWNFDLVGKINIDFAGKWNSDPTGKVRNIDLIGFWNNDLMGK